MASYLIVHTVNPPNAETEKIKSAAARALYAELLKYYKSKTENKKSA